MSDVKTLQEIQNLHGFHNLEQFSEAIPKGRMHNRVVKGRTELAIFPSDLRKEAIKWIKQNGGITNTVPDIKIETIEDASRQSMKAILTVETEMVLRWIKYFFNITEEDLIE